MLLVVLFLEVLNLLGSCLDYVHVPKTTSFKREERNMILCTFYTVMIKIYPGGKKSLQ